MIAEIVKSLPVHEIDDVMNIAMAIQRIPAISLAIAHGGRTVYCRGYGDRSFPDALSPDEHTVFRIASISKQFTAAAILLLQERGLVSIADSLSRYGLGPPYSDTIQIAQLLTHTSGIPGYTELPDFDGLCRQSVTPADVVNTISERPPAFAPQTQWQYSNTNYVILGQLIERISGRSYADFLNESFFVPLGLDRTGVADLTTIRLNEARGFSAYALGELERAQEWAPNWAFGTGGLFSTVTDLARWNGALRSGRVLTPESFARMSATAYLRDGLATHYGFGLRVDDAEGLREVRHTGGIPGYSLDNATYPDIDLDIIVLANVDGISTYLSITRRILALLLERPEFARWSLPAEQRSLNTVVEPPSPELWIERARCGKIDELPLDAAFGRFLTPSRRAALPRLSACGELRAVQLLERGRRDPTSTFSYRAEFERRTLLASITMLDSGAIANIAFREWDERQSA